MIINTRKKFLFIHIPKSAGSSITQALKGIPGSNKGSHGYPHYTFGDYENEYGDHLSKYFVFGIIRNPWSRLYSWYKFNQSRYRTRPRRYLNQPAFKNKDFEVDFNEWLLTRPFITSEEYQFNKNPIPAQQRSQFDWLKGSRQVDYIGTIEDIKTFGDKVGYIIGAKFSIPHINSTLNKIPYWKVYSLEAKEHVAKYFQADIEYGRYTFGE